MRNLLTLRARFAGTIQDVCAGVAMVGFIIVAAGYLEAIAS